MSERQSPLLWLIVGPNGAGKTTYHHRYIQPRLNLPFVNADMIARDRWPEAPEPHAYDAAEVAARAREALLQKRRSFVTETVFSHPSKLELIRRAKDLDYRVWMIFINLGSADLAVSRVARRTAQQGHFVPPAKVRSRYARLVVNILNAIPSVDKGYVVDNSEEARAFRTLVVFDRGRLAFRAKQLPAWAERLLAKARAERAAADNR